MNQYSICLQSRMFNFIDMVQSNSSKLFFVLLLCFGVIVGNAQQIKRSRGTVRIKHPNGQIMAKGKVKHHQKQGIWKYWDDQGRITSTTTFRNDSANGEYVAYSQVGRISGRGTYLGNKKNGTWLVCGSSGLVVAENHFVNDLLWGEQKSWYENGQLQERTVIYGDVLSDRRAWYANGRIKFSQPYVNGKPHGTWLSYPEPVLPTDTFPATVDEYKNGLLDGLHLSFAGSVKTEEFHYSKGNLNGSATKWNSSGQLEVYEVYAKGQLSGMCEYYRNGILIRKVNYKSDYKDGIETDYDRSARALVSYWYKMGALDSMVGYYENGRKAFSRRFMVDGAGKETSNYTEWDSAGVKLATGQFVSEQKVGKWTTYYPNGTVRSTTNYVDGKMNGIFTKWYPNGKKMVEMHVFATGLNTPSDVWDEKGKVVKMASKQYNEIVEGNSPGEVFIDPSKFGRAIIERKVQEVKIDPLRCMTAMDAEDLDSNYPAQLEDTNQVFMVVEQEPLFPGGPTVMMKFIADSLRYPKNAREAEVQGRVYLAVVIEKDGSVGPVTVLRGVPGAKELEIEAIRVVRLFPKFLPAKTNGRVVRYQYNIPVSFKLQ